jgi:hypothetical protein
MTEYRREDHDHACPCKLCVTFDIVYAMQETGNDFSAWADLPGFLTRERSKKLNWDLPPGHCLVCGGTVLWAWNLGEHYQIARHNTQEKDGKFYTSLMLHVGGPMYAVYRTYLVKTGGWGKLGPVESKKRFLTWASHLMDLSPEKCIGVASKDHGDWLEVRLGYTELVEENREQRIERYVRDAAGSSGKSTFQQDRSLQSASTLAWSLDTVLAPMSGRVPGAAKGPSNSSRTNETGG